MTIEFPGLFEVSLSEVAKALAEHAKHQGIRVTKTRVLKLLMDEISTGALEATVLSRSINGKTNPDDTMLDPRRFFESGHVWLVEHGLHSARFG